MGAGIGWALREGGHDVATSLAGRSARTARLAAEAGLRAVESTERLVSTADVVLVVTPPEAAVAAARSIAAACAETGARPLVADLNAVAPSTMEQIQTVLALAELDLVDGAISGPPPNVRSGARVYLAGPRAREVHDLAWVNARPILVSDAVGDASAVKMCTASVYKGTTGVLTQALRTARYYGVAELVLDDLGTSYGEPAFQVAFAATKAWRYVGEMHEIAAAQRAAAQPAELFQAMALVFESLARTRLAGADPETVDRSRTPAEIVAQLTEG